MKLEQTFQKSGRTESFRPTEEIYSALAYCPSKATKNDGAPERARHWLDVIIRDPSMYVNSAIFNAVLRAYARQGRVLEVEEIIESTPSRRNDVCTYEVLVEA
jgi:pentatricopeptide repeat protein